MLHRCIEGEKVGVDGSKIVDVDRRHDPCPGGTPAPPEARGREPPSFFFFLDLLPRWEKGFPSGPWLPWHGRGESPSEIGSVSLSLSISAFQILAFHRYLYSGISVTPIELKLSTRFVSGY